MATYTYRYYCQTESALITEAVSISASGPTGCVNSGAHTIDADSVSIIRRPKLAAQIADWDTAVASTTAVANIVSATGPISTHSDVNLSGISSDNLLRYNGTLWTNIGEENYIYGAQYAYAESEDVDSTNSDTYQQKLRLTTGSLLAGDYKIGWSYNWRHNRTSNNFDARVQIDDTTTITEQSQEPKDNGSHQKHIASGFKKMTLTAGVHTIDLDYKGGVNGTAYIWNARLEIKRVV